MRAKRQANPKKWASELESLRAELESLRAELENAQETIRAIQSGEVDALVVTGTEGERIFTLKSADQPYRILVETMSEGAVTLNSDGVVFYANRAFAEILQASLDSVIGAPISQYIREEDIENFNQAFVQARSGRSRCSIKLKSGQCFLIPAQLSMNVVQLEGGSGVCLVVTDLSEQRRLEAQKADINRLNIERELRERFVSTLSHDLRNPLSAMRTSAQILVRYPCQIEKHMVLGNRIIQSVDRADRMIQDLLDANLIRAGQKIPLQLAECDLFETARSTLEELSMAIGDRFDLQGDNTIRGYWSCEQLRRVIENLATNAIKYGAPNSQVKVKLRDKKDQVWLSIHNEGRGLTREEQAGLFKPFTRTQDAQSSGQRGWGLGLTLVRGVAEAHGGRVEVESAPGKGATFTVVLPKDARPFQNPLYGATATH